jgi:hypothetical protein
MIITGNSLMQIYRAYAALQRMYNFLMMDVDNDKEVTD